tara:strand:- start:35142 stop:35462 length:321 start_codon:yes stop_codon:yes gene_type:complete
LNNHALPTRTYISISPTLPCRDWSACKHSATDTWFPIGPRTISTIIHHGADLIDPHTPSSPSVAEYTKYPAPTSRIMLTTNITAERVLDPPRLAVAIELGMSSGVD